MTDRSNYGPSVAIARLYECTSKAGNTYFRGRMGMASVCLLKSQEIAPDSGAPIWHLMLSEAQPSKAFDVKRQTKSKVERDDEPEAKGDGKTGTWREVIADPVPF